MTSDISSLCCRTPTGCWCECLFVNYLRSFSVQSSLHCWLLFSLRVSVWPREQGNVSEIKIYFLREGPADASLLSLSLVFISHQPINALGEAGSGESLHPCSTHLSSKSKRSSKTAKTKLYPKVSLISYTADCFTQGSHSVGQIWSFTDLLQVLGEYFLSRSLEVTASSCYQDWAGIAKHPISGRFSELSFDHRVV